MVEIQYQVLVYDCRSWSFWDRSQSWAPKSLSVRSRKPLGSLHPVLDLILIWSNVALYLDAARNAAQTTPKSPSTMSLDEAYKILNVTREMSPEELQSVDCIILITFMTHIGVEVWGHVQGQWPAGRWLILSTVQSCQSARAHRNRARESQTQLVITRSFM